MPEEWATGVNVGGLGIEGADGGLGTEGGVGGMTGPPADGGLGIDGTDGGFGMVGMDGGFGIAGAAGTEADGAGMVGLAAAGVEPGTSVGFGGRLIIAVSRGLDATGVPSRRAGRTILTVSFFGSAILSSEVVKGNSGSAGADLHKNLTGCQQSRANLLRNGRRFPKIACSMERGGRDL